jgi:hypothetical protein
VRRRDVGFGLRDADGPARVVELAETESMGDLFEVAGFVEESSCAPGTD